MKLCNAQIAATGEELCVAARTSPHAGLDSRAVDPRS